MCGFAHSHWASRSCVWVRAFSLGESVMCVGSRVLIRLGGHVGRFTRFRWLIRLWDYLSSRIPIVESITGILIYNKGVLIGLMQ